MIQQQAPVAPMTIDTELSAAAARFAPQSAITAAPLVLKPPEGKPMAPFPNMGLDLPAGPSSQFAVKVKPESQSPQPPISRAVKPPPLSASPVVKTESPAQKAASPVVKAGPVANTAPIKPADVPAAIDTAPGDDDPLSSYLDLTALSQTASPELSFNSQLLRSPAPDEAQPPSQPHDQAGDISLDAFTDSMTADILSGGNGFQMEVAAMDIPMQDADAGADTSKPPPMMDDDFYMHETSMGLNITSEEVDEPGSFSELFADARTPEMMDNDIDENYFMST